VHGHRRLDQDTSSHSNLLGVRLFTHHLDTRSRSQIATLCSALLTLAFFEGIPGEKKYIIYRLRASDLKGSMNISSLD
jgi:hypothetical protein